MARYDPLRYPVGAIWQVDSTAQRKENDERVWREPGALEAASGHRHEGRPGYRADQVPHDVHHHHHV